MGLRAGDLDRRIRLERSTLARNEQNEPETAWAELATVWASKRDVSDGEKLRAAELGATVTTRFQIRWSAAVADLNPKDRLVFEGRRFDISGIKELGRREGLEITASAAADEGQA